MRTIYPLLLAAVALAGVTSAPARAQDEGSVEQDTPEPMPPKPEPYRPSPDSYVTRERYDKVVTAMFAAADTNHDGLVTLDEIHALGLAARQQAISARFAEVDANHDGTLSPAEFDAWQMRMGTDADKPIAAAVAEAVMPQGGAHHDAMLLRGVIEPITASLVAKANANYDGGVSLAELIAYEGTLFTAADANHDGFLYGPELRPHGAGGLDDAGGESGGFDGHGRFGGAGGGGGHWGHGRGEGRGPAGG